MRADAQQVLEIMDEACALPAALRPLVLLSLLDPQSDWRSRTGWTLGAINRGLADCHRRWLGRPDVAWNTDCPHCGATLALTLPLQAFPEEPSSAADCELLIGPLHARLRPPRVSDLIEAGRSGSLHGARIGLLEACVDSLLIEGRPAVITELSDELIEAVGERLLALDSFAELRVDSVCPACGLACRCELDLGQTLWTELRSRASNLIDDVHRLARAYGWSEAEILTLSDTRRARYLERVA